MTPVTSRRLTKRDFLAPTLLLVLSAIPMLGGLARVLSLSAPASAANARFQDAPAPVLLHIAAVALYCLLGAFQFPDGFRRRWPAWHRRAGKVLAVCGLVSGITGMWMAVFYAIPHGLQGPLLLAVRLLVGSALVAAIVIAWSSILRRQVARHEAWMIRAYALGQGAGTQAFVMLPWTIVFGEAEGLTRDLLMSLAWMINIVVAEWIIRRRSRSNGGRVPIAGLSPSQT
jgi:hypothetical protein